MKKRYLFLIAIASTILLASCQKTCICQGYDQLEHPFSEEYVDAHGGSCANMRHYPVEYTYSVCNWEY